MVDSIDFVGLFLPYVLVTLGLLVVAAIVVWLIIGLILWFVRGTHDSAAEEESVEWFDE